jgi:protein-disulfide isomerase/uncharacterized membrane protein
MKSFPRLTATRLLALTAMTVSAVLLVDHFRPDHPVCGFESACREVAASRFGQVLGVPLPLIGVLAFGALLGLSLAPSAATGRVRRALALAAGLAGLLLIFLQVGVLHRLCPYCLLVDVSAVLLAVLEVAGGGDGRPEALGGKARTLWLGGTAAALGLGIVVASVGSHGAAPRPEPPPPEVTSLWVPGKINVVEVADFQCPHCRKMHAVLSLFVDEERDRVHFVQLTAPMPAHPQARPAARAFLCAAQQGEGDVMAEALFAARDLAPAACERLAASLGLSLPSFRACVADPATDQRLDADAAWVRAASPNGLPVIWVQEQMLYGEQPIDALRAAARAAEERAAGPGVPGSPGSPPGP